MKKKILIGAVVLVAILVGAYFYLDNRNRTLSPSGTAELTNGDLKVSLTYARPSVRGRVIFGTEEQGALQPYGKYWRLGANESTEITFSKDVSFNGQALKAGSYRVYAIPGATEFEFAVNTALGRWGAFTPDESRDLFRTKIPVQSTISHVELYTISMASAENGVDIIFEWANVRLVVPIRQE
jgi:hypothetical protein